MSSDTINAYFDNLEGSAHGIHPNDMYNYDETNITDNPGSKKVIVPRGMRRVERKAEHSKQSVSVMFCGNASGQFLPPMVVYKAQNLYTEWTLGGPTNAVYDVSKSGWFDSRTFEMWFLKVFLANVNVSSRTPSTNPIFLIGDNLPSHFSVSVINECLKYNIVFVTMPAKSTHLCQPLDVAVFGPAKRAWRQILDGWQKESRSKGCIPKSQFPGLLKRLFNALPPSNLVSGFRACGIYPLDRTQVLKRLPSNNRDPGGEGTAAALNESVMSFLESNCGLNQTPNQAARKRGKKISPGQAITP